MTEHNNDLETESECFNNVPRDDGACEVASVRFDTNWFYLTVNREEMCNVSRQASTLWF